MKTKKKVGSLVRHAEALAKALESSGPPPECTDVKAAQTDRSKTLRLLRSPGLMRELAELDEMNARMEGRNAGRKRK